MSENVCKSCGSSELAEHDALCSVRVDAVISATGSLFSAAKQYQPVLIMLGHEWFRIGQAVLFEAVNHRDARHRSCE